MHRARVFFLNYPPLLALGLWTLATAANAATAPSLYGAIVPDADPQQAAQDAMRVVLVRLTGAREAGADTALSGLISDAAHYVQLQRTTTAGGTQILFDSNALNAAIAAAGRSVWNPDRPLLWVTLPQQDAALTDALRARVQAAALARGLPVTISVSSSTDQGDSAEALLAAARRAGASAALLASASPADPSTLQWSLTTAGNSAQFSGAPESAIDGSTDLLVRAAQELDAAPLMQFECRVAGVVDLPGYASVLGALSANPVVADVSVRAVDADTLTLQLRAHGSPALLQRALATDRLRATADGSSGAIEFRYQAGQ